MIVANASRGSWLCSMFKMVDLVVKTGTRGNLQQSH